MLKLRCEGIIATQLLENIDNYDYMESFEGSLLDNYILYSPYEAFNKKDVINTIYYNTDSLGDFKKIVKAIFKNEAKYITFRELCIGSQFSEYEVVIFDNDIEFNSYINEEQLKQFRV